jgi:hypothetical protein
MFWHPEAMALEELPERMELQEVQALMARMVLQELRVLRVPMVLLAQHLQPQRRERGQEVVV